MALTSLVIITPRCVSRNMNSVPSKSNELCCRFEIGCSVRHMKKYIYTYR